MGHVAIDKATVEHWARAVGLGNEVGIAVGQSNGSNREKALDFLISARWLIGEAAVHGLAASSDEVERHLNKRIDSVPNGRAEFEEEISSQGQTTADVKLEIEAQLAASALRSMIARRVDPPGEADIASYYRSHLSEFRIRDIRDTDLIESVRTRAKAIALGKLLGPGARFAKRSLHEHVERQTPYEAAHRGNGELVRTIFSAVPGRVAGPVRFNGAWVLVVVRRLVPGRTKPLAAVRGEIAEHLIGERHRLAVQSFLDAYRSKWLARTNCRPAFVVQKCAQYHGRVAVEPDPLQARVE